MRDKIPEIILKKEGTIPITHIASSHEYLQKLKEKMKEEVRGYMDTEHETHLIDLLELLEALGKTRGRTWKELLRLKEKKAKERGRFERKIILDES